MTCPDMACSASDALIILLPFEYIVEFCIQFGDIECLFLLMPSMFTFEKVQCCAVILCIGISVRRINVCVSHALVHRSNPPTHTSAEPQSRQLTDCYQRKALALSLARSLSLSLSLSLPLSHKQHRTKLNAESQNI